MIHDKIYTAAEAAEALSVTTRSLTDEARLGFIKGYKRFNRWYFLHSDLVKYIQGN